MQRVKTKNKIQHITRKPEENFEVDSGVDELQTHAAKELE